ncbi:MAG: hypothetical protein JSU81_04595 [Candidatus Coatesbacteria bacterium]|nr:MAG: hypothetical protein JSU81_04595 [Candidatus Coatesbacteria bacterium]
MKKTALALTALAVVVTAAYGTNYLGSVISSWDGRHVQGSATYYPLGITYGDGHIWLCYSTFFTKRLPATGSIVDLVGFSGRYGYDLGYETSTSYLYFACGTYGVYVRNSSTGADVRNFGLPAGATSASGIDFDNGTAASPVWLGDQTAWRIFNLTSTGSLVSSLSTTFGGVGGVAYDGATSGGPYLFAGTRGTPCQVYSVSPTSGSVLYSFEAPVSNGALRGLTWDGTYLWTIDNRFGSPNVGWVYQFIGYVPNIGVVPASVGKIKALYR